MPLTEVFHMDKRKIFFGSDYIQLAIVEGVSIISMACASKWLTQRPIGYLALAVPPYLAVLYGAVKKKDQDSRICNPWYWTVAILISTVVVIGLHMV